MRAKRSKEYRKLMQQYRITFGFREPYQVLVDAEMMEDADRFKMDLAGGLKRTLHGEIKPMITQCSIRHLYSATTKNNALIDLAKTFERRRCGHHLLDEPLSTLDCLSEVIDPKGVGVNKHKLVVASQDDNVRAKMRSIPGVPLIYIKKSVMILEPMAGATAAVKEREERGKFRAGVVRQGRNNMLGKRSREEDNEQSQDHAQSESERQEATVNKKRRRGPKEPNPLSVMKPKAREAPNVGRQRAPAPFSLHRADEAEGEVANDKKKKTRKRKHKSRSEEQESAAVETGSDG